MVEACAKDAVDGEGGNNTTNNNNVNISRIIKVSDDPVKKKKNYPPKKILTLAPDPPDSNPYCFAIAVKARISTII